MKVQNILGLTLKFFTLLGTISIVLLGVGIYFYSLKEVFYVIKAILFENPTGGEVIYASLKVVDFVLLGVMFFIIGLGLFELFIQPINNLPKWFEVKNIDQLKAMLIKVVVVVMAVSFTGNVVTSKGSTDLLGYGVGLAAVIFALSYFLKIKIKESKAGAALENEKNAT